MPPTEFEDPNPRHIAISDGLWRAAWSSGEGGVLASDMVVLSMLIVNKRCVILIPYVYLSDVFNDPVLEKKDEFVSRHDITAQIGGNDKPNYTFTAKKACYVRNTVVYFIQSFHIN